MISIHAIVNTKLLREIFFLLPLLAEYANNACEYACTGLFCRGHDLDSI